MPDRPAGGGVRPSSVSTGAGLFAMVALVGLGAAGLLLSPDLGAGVEDGRNELVTIGEPARSTDQEVGSNFANPPPGARIGSRLARAVTLSARGSGLEGLQISAAADSALLERARLQVGDVLLESDGQPLTATSGSLVRGHWEALDSVEMTIERDGQLRRLTIGLIR